MAVKQMAIVALKDGQPVAAVAPCGACRQVILESLARQTASFPVYLAEEHKVTKVENAGDLLPLAFGPDSL